MAKKDWKIGDEVTCRKAVEAYYSGRDGRPKQEFLPGMIGKIGAVDVPPVRGIGGNFCCVDFIGSDGETWRCAVRYRNLKKIKYGKLVPGFAKVIDDLMK